VTRGLATPARRENCSLAHDGFALWWSPPLPASTVYDSASCPGV
jgi:hypothetical protein